MSYNDKAIYEWNVDDLSYYQIIIMLHNMPMYATIYRTFNNSNCQITKFIVARFSG